MLLPWIDRKTILGYNFSLFHRLHKIHVEINATCNKKVFQLKANCPLTNRCITHHIRTPPPPPYGPVQTCSLRIPLPLWTDRQTWLKRLPSRNLLIHVVIIDLEIYMPNIVYSIVYNEEITMHFSAFSELPSVCDFGMWVPSLEITSNYH